MVMNQIIPGLFIGDIRSTQDKEAMKKNGITHVLKCMGGLQPSFPESFKYKVIDVADVPGQNVSRYFNEANRFIGQGIESGGQVLVHCFAGVSRSAVFATAFLMYYRALTVNSANLLIRKARYQIYPNPGFR